MCLITKPITTIAAEDIVCYKIFDKRPNILKTPYQGYRWPNGTSVVEEGRFGITLNFSGSLSVEAGLHAYTSKEAALSCGFFIPGFVIRQMIIPKGTQYMMSYNSKEIVALAMRLAKPEKKEMKKDVRPKRKCAKVSKGKLPSKRKKK